MKKIYFLLFAAMLVSFCSKAQLTYKDVAGIFYSRCTSCHHPNGGAPFSMMSYSQTYPYASSIQSDLNKGKMPPWSADTTYTRFLHERIITSTEKNAILSWISSGAQIGDPALVPPPPVYPTYQLRGTPDLILRIPTFASNAITADAYNCFSIPSGLTTDRIMRAIEIVPGNPRIVHHVVVSVDTTNKVASDLSGSCFDQPGDFGIGGYAPGSPPVVFPGQAPLKMGMRIKANSRIILQIHYPKGTAGQLDSTQIRFYFYPLSASEVRPVYFTTYLQNWTMNIPANTISNYTAQYPTVGTFTTSISIFSTMPHAHKVNRSMLIYAYKTTAPDTIPLVHIPSWNFDLQDAYVYPHLVKIPVGYKLGSKHLYDNTTNNPYNPNNPPKLVKAGTSTTDEMLFDSFNWMHYQPGDENIDIGSLLNTDSLLSAVNEIPVSSESITSYVFPNPVTQNATLIVTNAQVANCDFKMFDIYGKEVKMNITRNAEALSIQRGTFPSGVYFYSLSAGKFTGGGKIVFLPDK